MEARAMTKIGLSSVGWALALTLVLAACTGQGPTPAPTAEVVFLEAQSHYMTALIGAKTYLSYPRCPAKPICSNQAVADNIAGAVALASISMDQAETAVRQGANPTPALTALHAAIVTLNAAIPVVAAMEEK